MGIVRDNFGTTINQYGNLLNLANQQEYFILKSSSSANIISAFQYVVPSNALDIGFIRPVERRLRVKHSVLTRTYPPCTTPGRF